jgi:hypothetical protein
MITVLIAHMFLMKTEGKIKCFIIYNLLAEHLKN